jgi:hypothetical protein
MNRRRFYSAIGVLGVWSQFGPSPRAQQTLPVVGVLSGTNREPRLIDAVREGLEEAGFDGRSVAIEFRGAETRRRAEHVSDSRPSARMTA